MRLWLPAQLLDYLPRVLVQRRVVDHVSLLPRRLLAAVDEFVNYLPALEVDAHAGGGRLVVRHVLRSRPERGVRVRRPRQGRLRRLSLLRDRPALVGGS